jgi:hypothetical protein
MRDKILEAEYVNDEKQGVDQLFKDVSQMCVEITRLRTVNANLHNQKKEWRTLAFVMIGLWIVFALFAFGVLFFS